MISDQLSAGMTCGRLKGSTLSFTSSGGMPVFSESCENSLSVGWTQSIQLSVLPISYCSKLTGRTSFLEASSSQTVIIAGNDGRESYKGFAGVLGRAGKPQDSQQTPWGWCGIQCCRVVRPGFGFHGIARLDPSGASVEQ